MSVDSLTVNGESRPLDAHNVAELLASMGVDTDTRGIAVALNGTLLPRGRWGTQSLRAGDRLEVVKAFAGG